MTVLVTLCSLLVLGSSYVYHLQNWLVLNAKGNVKGGFNNMAPSVDIIGIRTIVTENTLDSTSSLGVNYLLQQVEDDKKLTGLSYPGDYSNTESLTQLTDDYSQIQENFIYEPINQKVEKRKLPLIKELENEIQVLFPKDYSRQEKLKILSRLLVLPGQITVDDVLSSTSINTANRPNYYNRVLNQYGSSIRYPAQAYRYAEYLLLNESLTVNKESGDYQLIQIALHHFKLPQNIEKYQEWVREFSPRHGIASDLVYAIMDVESAFNPLAVSSSNALGLMQIKAGSAGRDVYKLVDGRSGQPSAQTLFNPKENIRIGIAYLGLLKNMYFQKINSESKKDILAIASYNGGLNTVLKLFGKTNEEAINQLNRMSESSIYKVLLNRHESTETRRYVQKVSDKRKKYQKILERAA